MDGKYRIEKTRKRTSLREEINSSLAVFEVFVRHLDRLLQNLEDWKEVWDRDTH
jgi:hypothetical protein